MGRYKKTENNVKYLKFSWQRRVTDNPLNIWALTWLIKIINRNENGNSSWRAFFILVLREPNFHRAGGKLQTVFMRNNSFWCWNIFTLQHSRKQQWVGHQYQWLKTGQIISWEIRVRVGQHEPDLTFPSVHLSLQKVLGATKPASDLRRPTRRGRGGGAHTDRRQIQVTDPATPSPSVQR